MKKIMVVLALVIALGVLPSVVFGSATYPPGLGGWAEPGGPLSYFDWVTAPYQRNIYWDFSTDPRVNHPQYDGYLDSLLSGTDSVNLTGDTQWSPSNPTTYVIGGVGLNPNGSGSANFFIDNTDDPAGFKHIYFEAVFLTSGPSFAPPEPTVTAFGSQNQYSVSYGDFITIIDWDTVIDYPYPIAGGAELWLMYGGITVTPNPYEEILIFNFNTGNNSVWLTDFHVATECASVPLPGAAWLLGSGLIGLIGFARRFLS